MCVIAVGFGFYMCNHNRSPEEFSPLKTNFISILNVRMEMKIFRGVSAEIILVIPTNNNTVTKSAQMINNALIRLVQLPPQVWVTVFIVWTPKVTINTALIILLTCSCIPHKSPSDGNSIQLKLELTDYRTLSRFTPQQCMLFLQLHQPIHVYKTCHVPWWYMYMGKFICCT